MRAKQIAKRVSSRVYPKIACRQCNELFFPSDARQTFCCAQHRIDFNNDQRKIRKKPENDLFKIYNHCERVLEKIYDSVEIGKEVSIELFKYEKFNFQHNITVQINKITNRKVYWFFNFGIEPLTKNSEQCFIVHKRDLNGKQISKS